MLLTVFPFKLYYALNVDNRAWIDVTTYFECINALFFTHFPFLRSWEYINGTFVGFYVCGNISIQFLADF